MTATDSRTGRGPVTSQPYQYPPEREFAEPDWRRIPVHQEKSYDRIRGISCWTKNYLTPLEAGDPEAPGREYLSYDPVDTLPEEGKEYWRAFVRGQAKNSAQ